mgnify:CR=1 FL=1|tara:strand:+ start:863 stop:1189 length:327 start_codon:yes stop_codon:yes gene_type:complete
MAVLTEEMIGDSMYTGDGEYTWPDGKKYEGPWLNGLQNGEGKETEPEGHVYEGGFVSGERIGSYKKTFANGVIVNAVIKEAGAAPTNCVYSNIPEDLQHLFNADGTLK